MVKQLLNKDHSLVRFYIPQKARWGSIALQTTNVGEYLTDAVRSIAREDPKLQGVIDIVDSNATAAGQKVISDDKPKVPTDILGRYRLGLKDVEPDTGQGLRISVEKICRRFWPECRRILHPSGSCYLDVVSTGSRTW